MANNENVKICMEKISKLEDDVTDLKLESLKNYRSLEMSIAKAVKNGNKELLDVLTDMGNKHNKNYENLNGRISKLENAEANKALELKNKLFDKKLDIVSKIVYGVIIALGTLAIESTIQTLVRAKAYNNQPNTEEVQNENNTIS